MVGANDAMAVAYAVSGPADNPQIRIAGRLRGDAAGRLRPAAAVKVSATPQAPDSTDESSLRFGDYFDMALDAGDGSGWLMGEYVKTPDQWGMWAGHIAWHSS